MKRKLRLGILACALAVTMAFAGGLLAGCTSSSSSSASASASASETGTRIFTDSLGRQVEIPNKIDKIVPSGHTANQVLLTFAPDLMVGLSQDLTDDQAKYIGAKYQSLPALGAIFGAKGDLNKEAVVATGAQILIDWGDTKDGMAEDLDALQEQLGIPCVHITATLETYGDAYAMLGDLLGMEERGKELGDYCTNAYKEVEAAMAKIPEEERYSVAYLVGDGGTHAICKGSYQGSVIDLCSNNACVVEKASGSGNGNEISLEQISVWDPQVILFVQSDMYDTVASDEAWSELTAIKDKAYYEVPSTPYNWLHSPPTVNQIMGLQWLPRLLYPEAFTTDLKSVTTSYYKTFYGYDLTEAEYNELVAKAI